MSVRIQAFGPNHHLITKGNQSLLLSNKLGKKLHSTLPLVQKEAIKKLQSETSIATVLHISPRLLVNVGYKFQRLSIDVREHTIDEVSGKLVPTTSGVWLTVGLLLELSKKYEAYFGEPEVGDNIEEKISNLEKIICDKKKASVKKEPLETIPEEIAAQTDIIVPDIFPERDESVTDLSFSSSEDEDTEPLSYLPVSNFQLL